MRLNTINREIVVYVVVQFYPWYKFYFSLLGMVMYDDEFKTKLKGNKILNQVYNRTTTSTSRLSYSADHTIATEPKAFKVTPTLFI